MTGRRIWFPGPCLGLFASLGLFSVAPAQAEVRLSGEAGGNFRIAVMSWSEIPFRSVVRQQYDFSCGSAALATLLTHHYDAPIPEARAFEKMWSEGDQEAIRKAGFSMLDMKNYLVSEGYRAEGFRLNTAQLRELNRPGIVLVNLNGYKHFVVVKGIRGDRILVGDPMLGLSEYSSEDFSKMWNGVLLAILDEEQRPAFNLVSDWGPWSIAPLEQGSFRVPAAGLTDHLPMDYQISSELLLNVRGGIGS